jgi:manganese-transporting P-type ATPase
LFLTQNSNECTFFNLKVMEGLNKMRAEFEHSLGDINDPNRPASKMGWFDWMEMDLEEHAARKKREKERNVLDSLPKHMRVPSRYATSFFPTLFLGVLVTLHALVLLLQYWSVSFHTWINYQEVQAESVHLPDGMFDIHIDAEKDQKKDKSLDSFNLNLPNELPTHVRIVPSKGPHLLASIDYYPILGMTFEYHRRRYVFNFEEKAWIKIRCRTDIPLSFLDTWNGFKDSDQTYLASLRYGPNAFEIKQPTFSEMYKKQLLSPFTVFQLFCVILWMLDDYWQYSAFTLFMILTFEATVVFSRLKSLQALRGMGNKDRPIWVFRVGKWLQIQSTDLLPGDLLSLTRIKPHYAKNDEKKRGIVEDEGGDVVPADILLLRGSTVVNEASLTGESVPQMKEGLIDLTEGEFLSIKTSHKSNVLYAGTKMLQCKAASEIDRYSSIPQSPDGGALAFCLRTGFSSAQGKLVRMIEGSQEKVKGHEKETGLLLLLLFFFALASSSYVLHHGMKNDKRSKYELLLHCIMIVTSVIPPELPMQMALAVNNSLMTLMKMGIFCTEPFRVPIAGKLNACLFDKTGTLTTDELVAVGVCEPENWTILAEKEAFLLTPMSKLDGGAALVLAGCHSLVYIDEETTGDPLESASLNSLRWTLSPTNGNVIPKTATSSSKGGKPIDMKGIDTISEVEILARHHFSSKLQCMSCVIRTSSRKGFAVAKGSPEAIGKMLIEKPANYDQKAKYLAKEGYRVIALAFKTLQTIKDLEAAKDTRAVCEENLTFAGFIAFTCRVRKDTADVLKRLKDGGMSIAMITGDAILTAIHVAKEVGICEPTNGSVVQEVYENEKNQELQALLETKRSLKASISQGSLQYKPILILEQRNESLYWASYDDESKVADFVARDVPVLSLDNDLATTGKSLSAAFEFDIETRSVLEYFKVFARMTPDAKETVIESLHSVGKLCMMCGDGANDVGALKQSDVGVALLTGFGDLNVDRGDDGDVKAEVKKDKVVKAVMNAEHLDAVRALPIMLIKARIRQYGTEPDKYPELNSKDDLVRLYDIVARELAVKRNEEKEAKEKAKMSKSEQLAKHRADAAEKQRKMMARVAELEAQGEQWATFKALREMYNEEAEKAKANKRQFGTVEGSAAAMAAQLEGMESADLPMVKLGDASVAAPFTSKIPSIRSCVDIVRQGRCTLVSSIQMYQILALNCLISSYSLSVLYLDGVKYGDTQMTAMGMLGSISFMSVSRSKPLDKLSKVRPLTSIFHPALFLSLLGQFSIHLVVMILATRSAKQHLPPDHEPDLDGVFKPGILNTVVFLVSNVQQVCVFVVNLQGRPFMTGLTENRPLLWSLLGTFILTFMFATETAPGLNKYFQLVAFPDDQFRDYVLSLLVFDVIATFLLDRVLKFIFCPKILLSSVEGTTWKDVLGLSRTIAVMIFLMYSFLGNNDQWEQLMLQEGRFEELGLNGTNMTNLTNVSIVDNIIETVTDTIECVGETCKSALLQGISDEF